MVRTDGCDTRSMAASRGMAARCERLQRQGPPRRPVFRVLSIAIACAVGALPCRSARCQADAVAARAEQAIADYEQCKQLPADSAQRRRCLHWLGEVDHASVTEYLRQELAAAGNRGAAVAVLDAIAQVPRADLQPDVWEVLQRTSVPATVQNAAGRTIARFGDRGVDRLIEFVRTADAGASRARDAAITALIDHGGDRGHRGLAQFLLQGPMSERLLLLRRMDRVHGVPPVSLARIRLVGDGDLITAAVAWRQLAEEGHARARALAIDVLERLLEQPPPPVAAELIRGIVQVHDPDLWPLLLRYGSMPGDVVRKAVRAAAPAAANDRALIDWLLRKGLGSDRPAAREVAQQLLAEAPADAVGPLLETVRAELRRPGRSSLDRAVALHPLLAKDPGWQLDLRNLALSNDREVRIVGLSLLLDLGADVAIQAAQKSLGHSAWELRSVAYRYLTKCRDVSSIPLLIDRVEREDGRLAHELGNALFAHTGTRCWSRRQWQQWWEEHRLGFVLPPVAAVRGGIEAGAGQTIAYHGIPLVSKRIAFLIDVSGSMKQPLSTDKKRTRLVEAKEQLTRVLTALPEDHSCNLIAYDAEVHPVWDCLRRVSADNRAVLLDATARLAIGTATNIFDALETAFRDPEVDTIYLLTDGEPTVGRLVDTDDIVEEVTRWNRQRQVVVHCIGLGVDSRLLRRLAESSGGEYRHVE